MNQIPDQLNIVKNEFEQWRNSRPKQGWKDMGNYFVNLITNLQCRRRNFERLTTGSFTRLNSNAD